MARQTRSAKKFIFVLEKGSFVVRCSSKKSQKAAKVAAVCLFRFQFLFMLSLRVVVVRDSAPAGSLGVKGGSSPGQRLACGDR